MKRFLLLLCLLAGGAWGSPGGSGVSAPRAIDIPKWFTESFLDLREDIRDAAKQDRRLLLYFGQDGCPYCKALIQEGFGRPDVAAKTRRHFTTIALNLWGDREVTWIDGRRLTEKELGLALRVQFTPTLLFFDEKGAVVLRLDGYAPPAKLHRALDYASGRMEGRQSFTDYLAGLPEEAAGAALIAEPFFERGPADLRRLKASGKPVLVVYARKSCRDCVEMHREGFARADVRRLLARFKVVQLDLLGERKVVAPEGKSRSERAWAQALQVTNTPSFLFFDSAGKEIFRADGYLRPFHLASALEYVADGAYREEPSFQRFVQKRSEALRAAGQPVDLWK